MDSLVFDGVSHAFGERPVLRDISLRVGVGEVLCLLGPSGCGKTTALRLAAGLEMLQRGRIVIDGQEVAAPGHHVPPEKRSIGMVFQDFALFPHLSVRDNVAFGLRPLPRRDRLDRVMAALALTGMDGRAACFPHTLSGGQQQRVALSRALAPQPRLLLLDEPFSGLDTHLRGRLREEALQAVKAAGVATVMVTHDPDEAMAMADRLAVMEDGRIVQQGGPADLYYAPVDAMVAGFFGEPNRLEGTVIAGRVATPVGSLPAPTLADGTPVTVLVRPEAFILGDTADGGVAAEVTDIRALGRTAAVHLRIGTTSMVARLPGHAGVTSGGTVGVMLDPRQVFVFPAA